MKTFLLAALAGVFLMLGQSVSHADAGYSFSFSVEQKHDAGTKTTTYYSEQKNQNWYYKVTMDNKSFKDVSGIEIKYVVFSKQEQFSYDVIQTTGVPLQRHPGSLTMRMVKNNDTVTFNTDGIALTNVTYNDGYYADEGAKGALRGIWIRVYVGGQMVAEFMNPTGLSQKVQFDGPPDEKKKKGQ